MAEHGVLATIQHFSKVYPDRPLKQSTVRGWKNQYNRKVVRLKNSGKEVVVSSLASQTAFFRFSLWWWKKGSGPVHRCCSS